MNTAISITNLKKSYNSTHVFDNFSLSIKKGAVTILFGPNGSGKSTLLNMLASVEKPDSGDMMISDFNIRKFSYVFQNYRESLLPWRTGIENILYPLEIQHYPKHIIKERAQYITDIFQWNFSLSRFPYELSGGEQQILVFLRTLVTEPSLMFIDESFSALDYENSLRLRHLLQQYYTKHNPTIVMVSHSIEEAAQLGGTILVFSQKPTRVVQTIHNPLPYPRTANTLKTSDFNTVKNEILSAFQTTVRI